MELYIVDDNPDHQFLVFKLIKALDKPYQVTFFENGRSLHKQMQQLSRLGQHEEFPDLLVLDLNMPGMNGIDLLRLLRQPPVGNCPQIKDIPIVIMTSDISSLQIDQCYQSGANAVIIKPLNFSVLAITYQAICKFWIG
jgi:CheY-like chemotaxis protein